MKKTFYYHIFRLFGSVKIVLLLYNYNRVWYLVRLVSAKEVNQPNNKGGILVIGNFVEGMKCKPSVEIWLRFCAGLFTEDTLV